MRQGRFSPAQREACATLLPRFGISYAPAILDLQSAFGRPNPKILEIGFGMGETTATIAAQQPENDFLAIDVHMPGVGSLLRLIERDGLANVRLVPYEIADRYRPELATGGVARVVESDVLQASARLAACHDPVRCPN